MAYHCRDCSYRGKRGGQLGGCPACGSPNMVMLSPPAAAGPEPPGKFRMVLLVGAWTVFLGLLAWKLVT